MNKISFCNELGITVEELDILYRTVKKSQKVPTKGISHRIYKIINDKYNFSVIPEFIDLYKSLSSIEDKQDTNKKESVNYWGSSDYTKKSSTITAPWDKTVTEEKQPPIWGDPIKINKTKVELSEDLKLYITGFVKGILDAAEIEQKQQLADLDARIDNRIKAYMTTNGSQSTRSEE